MEQLLDEELKKAFPSDTSKSIMIDVLRECKFDTKKAKEIALRMGNDQEEEKKKEKERKVREIKGNFPDVAEDAIEKLLEENDWNVDKVIISAFELDQKQKQKDIEKERDQRREKGKEEAKGFLKIAFKNIPETKIQEILEANEGDVDATTEQLLAFVFAQEEKQKEENKRKAQDDEAKRIREAKLEALRKQFPELVSMDEVTQALDSQNGDVRAATASLLKLSESRKFEQLKKCYHSLDESEVRDALEQNEWDMRKAMKALYQVKEKKKAKEAEEERKRKEQEELALQKRLAEEEAKREKLEQEEADKWRKRIEDEERQKREKEEVERKKQKELEEERKRKQREEAERLAKEKEQAGETVPEDDGFMKRSIAIGKVVSDRLEEEKKAKQVLAKELLDELVRGDELPGVGRVIETRQEQEQREKGQPAPVTASENKPAQEQTPSPVTHQAPEVSISLVETAVNLSVAKDRYEIGTSIVVEWEVEEPNFATTTSDWIGIYRVDAKHSQYETYQWIGAGGAKKGSLSFQAPSEFNSYEFRYFSNRSYQAKGTSKPFAVGPLVQISAEKKDDFLYVTFEQKAGKVYPNAWIAMYPKAEKDNTQYRAYDWIQNANDNALKFKAPKTGVWEFRYFPQKSYGDVARCSISVDGTDKLDLRLNEAEGLVEVNCNIVTVDPERDYVWVGLYFVEQQDHRQWRRYKYVAAGEATKLIFKQPKTAGTYEARLFANKSYEPICKSAQTIVLK